MLEYGILHVFVCEAREQIDNIRFAIKASLQNNTTKETWTGHNIPLDRNVFLQ